MRLREELSHRERIRLALNHQEADRVPIAFVCSGVNPPARREWDRYLRRERGVGVDEFLTPLLDIRQVFPDYIGPALAPDTDIWGVHRSLVGGGLDAYNEIDCYPLASAHTLDDIRSFPWPDPGWFDDSVLPERIAQAHAGEEYCLMLANHNVFETAWYMRGFEQMLVDLLEAPDISHEILERVCRFYEERLHRSLSTARGQIDLVFTADDIGGQTGLLISLKLWEAHLKPYHARLNRIIHEYGAKVIYHSDGSVAEAVPGLLDAGIDVLQALQFDARGMDPAALKASFGDRLCFQGGVSVQHTLPFGTVEDVRAEVKSLIAVLGQNGGYILGPSHAIQAGTPPENITAMFDAALERSHP
ncbi:MAG: hypothetical protein IT210_03510 [Armatimonadetes bacterium]|nr:hypothetical protein [Armatimonadota bacterium]